MKKEKVEEMYVPNDEPLLKVGQKLDKVEKKFEDMGYALEILRDMKESNKRKDRIFCTIIMALIVIIALLIGGFFWYESQFETVTEETTQTIDDIENPGNSTFTQTIN